MRGLTNRKMHGRCEIIYAESHSRYSQSCSLQSKKLRAFKRSGERRQVSRGRQFPPFSQKAEEVLSKALKWHSVFKKLWVNIAVLHVFHLPVPLSLTVKFRLFREIKLKDLYFYIELLCLFIIIQQKISMGQIYLLTNYAY